MKELSQSVNLLVAADGRTEGISSDSNSTMQAAVGELVPCLEKNKGGVALGGV